MTCNIRCNTLQHGVTFLVESVTHTLALLKSRALSVHPQPATYVATHCNTLFYTLQDHPTLLAVGGWCCSELQCVAKLSAVSCLKSARSVSLQCVAVCCCVLQCVAVCCSVLRCVAVFSVKSASTRSWPLFRKSPMSVLDVNKCVTFSKEPHVCPQCKSRCLSSI